MLGREEGTSTDSELEIETRGDTGGWNGAFVVFSVSLSIVCCCGVAEGVVAVVLEGMTGNLGRVGEIGGLQLRSSIDGCC